MNQLFFNLKIKQFSPPLTDNSSPAIVVAVVVAVISVAPIGDFPEAKALPNEDGLPLQDIPPPSRGVDPLKSISILIAFIRVCDGGCC